MKFGDGFATPPIGEYHPRLDPAFRAEFEQRNLDLVEEGKLKEHEHATQLHLLGVWDGGWGCPHYHNRKAEDIGGCETREMRPCILETDHAPCLIFGKIIEEMKEEYEIIKVAS